MDTTRAVLTPIDSGTVACSCCGLESDADIPIVSAAITASVNLAVTRITKLSSSEDVARLYSEPFQGRPRDELDEEERAALRHFEAPEQERVDRMLASTPCRICGRFATPGEAGWDASRNPRGTASTEPDGSFIQGPANVVYCPQHVPRADGSTASLLAQAIRSQRGMGEAIEEIQREHERDEHGTADAQYLFVHASPSPESLIIAVYPPSLKPGFIRTTAESQEGPATTIGPEMFASLEAEGWERAETRSHHVWSFTSGSSSAPVPGTDEGDYVLHVFRRCE